MNNNKRILNDLGDYGDAEFDVKRLQLYYYGDSQMNNVDSHVALIREDTNKQLSIVGSKYTQKYHIMAQEHIALGHCLNTELH